MVNYTLYNLSTVINNNNLQAMIKAINNYLITFCNDWNLTPIKLNTGIYNSHVPIPNNSILMMDDNDSGEDGVLGYHYEENGNVISKIFARTILNYGGAILYRDTSTFTVAQCVSHELLESIGNPEINKWALSNDGLLYAVELCDVVESNLIIYSIPGNKVGLSDYVLPSFFSPDATNGPYNKLNTLSAPFTIDSGGYSIVIDIVEGYIDSISGMENTHENSLGAIKKRISASFSNSKMKELIANKSKLKLKSK